MKFKLIAGSGGAILIAFIAVVISSGAGWNPLKISWDFSNTGQFGDSFGFISSFMAALAAVAALAAYRLQFSELSRLKDSYDTDRLAAQKRDFEHTFFSLLDMWRGVVKEIDILGNTFSEGRATGRDAIQVILNGIKQRSEYNKSGNKKLEGLSDHEKTRMTYLYFYKLHQNDLGHYFRLLYHIIRYVDASEISDPQFYMRILRATISSSEISLIGLNCIYGGGIEKLKPLVEKYAILHNISQQDADEWAMLSHFSTIAFGDRDFALEKRDSVSDNDFFRLEI